MEGYIKLLRGSTEVASWHWRWHFSSFSGSAVLADIAPSVISHIDFPDAGTYTYTLQSKVGTTNTRINITAAIVAMEL
jgi:hypothetical protein